MNTTFKIDFEGDIYELKGNNWGKEILYRNNEILLTKRNVFKSRNEYEFDCSRNGHLKLSFDMDMWRKVISVKIYKEEELLAEHNESIEHLVPEWVKKIDKIEEDSEEEEPNNSKKKIIYALFSLVAAMIIWGLMFSWIYALVLILVLFIHELGHFIAMAIFGYKNKGIVFAPPFGAVAYGIKKDESPREKVVVLLAGPLPGIFIGFTLLFSGFTLYSEQITKGIAIQFLILNYINLLPICPLDGGRIVDMVFLHKFPKVQLVLAGLGLIFIGIYGIISYSFIMIVIAVLFAFVLFGRVYELNNENKRKEIREGNEVSTLSRVVVSLIYLTLCILLLFFLIV